jgi:hypothetical protein
MASAAADTPESNQSATCDNCNNDYIIRSEKSNGNTTADGGDLNTAYERLDTAYDEPNTAYNSIISSDSNLTATTGAHLEPMSTNDKNSQPNDEYLKLHDEYLQPNDEYLLHSDKYLQLQSIVASLQILLTHSNLSNLFPLTHSDLLYHLQKVTLFVIIVAVAALVSFFSK